ncbi:hypothetical protein SDC9_164061 [bioreactor metagenome]|uniref:Uncharacterized protein n=1 Tax=bioreactor metagenome TaxID=1076179 RepID=A0A645FSM0_9ZZZZ
MLFLMNDDLMPGMIVAPTACLTVHLQLIDSFHRLEFQEQSGSQALDLIAETFLKLAEGLLAGAMSGVINCWGSRHVIRH